MTKTKSIRRRDYRKFGFFGLAIFVAVFLFMFLAQKSGKLEDDTNAANLANFQAGYIISDFQMTDYTSMSEADIQNFLNRKGNCGNTDLRGVGTRVEYFSDHTPPTTWHVYNGRTICLAEENINGETAAHIIWQAAQDYRINPKVLIVLIQKETGLITDPIPNSWDYQRTAGYGCPDTAACSEKYYGFKNQIRNAAYLFRVVMDGNSSYYPIGYNNVRYSPNPDCGSSVVYINNLATSALYRYTPYQPNAGALAAGYGTAPCGAYGNRNFYAYFEDWFGNITWDGWPSLATVLSNNRVQNENTDLALTYQTHIEHYGWLGWANGGEMAGTAGYGARMEAIALKLANNETGIEYRTHIQDYGWTGYVKDGEVSGTTGQSKRIEAIQIRLTGELAKRYDVYYRAHVQNKGWTGWVKNDEVAGTTGQSLRMEAIQIKLVKKKQNNGLEYRAHVQNIGWMGEIKDGETAGTTGRSFRMEAIEIKLPEKLAESGSIEYETHVQNIGWMDPVKDGETAGTTGRSFRMEAIKINLTGELARKYDVYYRAHVQNIGWMSWIKNGELAGTTGRSLQMEALEIELVEK
ncbi:MAG: hypothetical protein Q4F58_00370 [Candidatus Saccharibacteria bacterium]|nr:hypothetical protein [Candidatus Saccharibacteria bacterium]